MRIVKHCATSKTSCLAHIDSKVPDNREGSHLSLCFSLQISCHFIARSRLGRPDELKEQGIKLDKVSRKKYGDTYLNRIDE